MVTDFKATQRRSSEDVAVGIGYAHSLFVINSVVFLTPSPVDTFVNFGIIPSNARICSRSTARPTPVSASSLSNMSIGLCGVDNGVGYEKKALRNVVNLDTFSAGSIPEDTTKANMQTWEFIDGLTEDPGGEFYIVGSVDGVETVNPGYLAFELFYSFD